MKLFQRIDREHRWELSIFLILCIIILGLHVTVWQKAGGLWRDEANTAAFAQMSSLSQIRDSLSYDSFPIGASVVLHAWTFITTSDYGLRFFGFLVGLGIVVALWFCGKFLGFGWPILSLLLFEFNPIALKYGDSIRPFGLGILFILITTGLIFRVVQGTSWKVTLAATIAAILSVQFMYQNSFLLLSICLGGAIVTLIHRNWKRTGIIIGIGLVAALSLLPYLYAIRQAQSWQAVLASEVNVRLMWSAVGQALGAPGRFMIVMWLALFALSLVTLLLWNYWKKGISDDQKDLFIFSIITVVTATIGFVLFIQTTKVLAQPWHFIPLMALVAVCLEAIFRISLPNRMTQIWTLSVLVIAILITPRVWQAAEVRHTNVDIIAAKLMTLAAQDDLIVVDPWYLGVSFNRYYRGNTAWVTIPPLADLSIHRYDLLQQLLARSNSSQAVFEGIQAILASGKHVWVVADEDELKVNFSSMAFQAQPVNLNINFPVSAYENPELIILEGRPSE